MAHRKKSGDHLPIVDLYASIVATQRSRATTIQVDGIDINQEFARREKIRNDNAEQDITLRRTTLNVLFKFLLTETAVVFLFAFFEAIHWPFSFNLDDWSFRLLVGATIAQIALMLTIAVKYLFPQRRNKE